MMLKFYGLLVFLIKRLRGDIVRVRARLRVLHVSQCSGALYAVFERLARTGE